MWVKATVGSIVMLANSGAFAGHLTYSQWAALDDGRRAVYMAGVIDRLANLVPATASSKQGMHYQRCVLEGEMTSGQLSDNVLTFARSFPEVQKLSARAALIQYLNRLCGILP